MRLDDDQTRISGARRADVTGVGAWEPPCRGIGIAKILKKLQLHPRQGCHPVDVGYNASDSGLSFNLVRSTPLRVCFNSNRADVMPIICKFIALMQQPEIYIQILVVVIFLSLLLNGTDGV